MTAMTRGAIRLSLLLAAVSAGLYAAGSWNSGILMDAEEAAGRENAVASPLVRRFDGLAPVLAAPSAPITYSTMLSPPEWLCLSQRVQRGRVELRRFAIAHQRESDHEWEIACEYGPAFPRGGI